MYHKHSLNEYNLAITLRKKFGYGSRRIEDILKSDYGIEVGIGAINRWIYKNGKPFNEVIIKKIPKTSELLNLEKAYVLGVLCGDGCVSTGYRIGLGVCDKDFSDYFQFCLEKVYALKCGRSERTDKGKRQYIISLCSKRIVEDLSRYTSSFKSREWIIPKQILNAKREFKAAFIRGFADSEGGVRFRRTGFGEISLTSGNKESLLTLQKMLFEDFGIKSRFKIRKTKTVFVLYIGDFNSLVLFGARIGFVIRRKLDVLRLVLESYKRGSLRTYSVDFKLNALKLMDKYEDHRFVGQLVGTSFTNIYDWERARLNGKL